MPIFYSIFTYKDRLTNWNGQNERIKHLKIDCSSALFILKNHCTIREEKIKEGIKNGRFK